MTWANDETMTEVMSTGCLLYQPVAAQIVRLVSGYRTTDQIFAFASNHVLSVQSDLQPMLVVHPNLLNAYFTHGKMPAGIEPGQAIR
ncbi:unnamed protein product [Heligmosomoides polygyrus]|uniref:Hint domain-containing protein n=1 Tax=Heligmosomoides polygyrus TaxID=6339 RepID=A0A183GBD9_HELPZ|nr:unnamed protein product [Heligmosomoides polygyrus]